MEVFEYQGRNRRGEMMRGTVESSSAQAVATWLMGTDIYPTSIRPRAQPRREPDWWRKLTGRDKVSPVQLLLFTRQMANMVRAGLQMLDAIDGIRRTAESPALAKVLQAVCDDMDRGVVLSSALARHPAVFDGYYVNMIRVGEGTGKLEEAFRNLYRQLDFDREMRQKIRSAMRYPTFVLIALAVGLATVTLFVIPAFAKTYASMKVELPLITQILLWVSSFAVNYWWAALFYAALAGGIVQIALKRPRLRYAWDKFKLRLPISGEITNKATIARFSRSFATALKSDVPIVTAFQLVARVVDNAFFEDRVLQMRAGIERGEILSRVMRTSGIFSPLELQLVTVAERTGDVDHAVDQIAQLYTEEVEYQVAKLSQTVEPLLLAIMGAMVGILLLGVFLPMWDLGSAYFQK